MEFVWGLFLTALSLVAWCGQIIYAVNPKLGAKLGVGESDLDVDSTFYVDARGEAIWDCFILWTLPTAGLLLMFNNPIWIYFGLVGGGCYVYFVGRNLVTRTLMQRHKISIGKTKNIKIANIFLILWGLSGLITILMALNS